MSEKDNQSEGGKERVSFKVESTLCAECAMAMRRFIGHMKGVESIEVERGDIVVDFDSSKIDREELLKITTESIEKLGYKLERS
jgi:copper chaperone CopZ